MGPQRLAASSSSESGPPPASRSSPRQVFLSFDRLLLLEKGEVVYAGRASDAVGYFAAEGFPTPHGENPADWIFDVLAEASDARARSERRERRARERREEEGVSGAADLEVDAAGVEGDHDGTGDADAGKEHDDPADDGVGDGGDISGGTAGSEGASARALVRKYANDEPFAARWRRYAAAVIADTRAS